MKAEPEGLNSQSPGEGVGLREEVVAELAECWNAESLNYAVIGGLEHWPEKMGRDLDVLVPREDWDRAVNLTRNKLGYLGWRTICYKRPWSRHVFAFIGSDSRWISLEVDFFSTIRWGATLLVTDPGQTVLQAPFRQDAWAAFVKGVLLQTLAGNWSRMKSRGLPHSLLSANRRILEMRLGAEAGSTLARSFLNALEAEDWPSIQAIAGSLRRIFLMKGFRSGPVKSIRGAIAWIRRRWWHGFQAGGGVPSIALVGPDGAGKTSTIEAMERILLEELRFPGVERRHWRPGLLPSLGSMKRGRNGQVSVEGPGPPRRTSGRGTLLRILWYGLDYILGNRFLDRTASLRFRPIIYDRCALDMAVDPARYGLRPKVWLLSASKWLPRPDLVVLLVVDPERIDNRKSEIGTREIIRQYGVWRQISTTCEINLLEIGKDEVEVVAWRISSMYIARLLRGRANPQSEVNEGRGC